MTLHPTSWLDSTRVGNTGPSTSHNNYEQYASPPTNVSSAEDPLAGALLGVADVITKLVIAHPCTVLRRQCQVHQFARSLHLTPVTLVPVICNMVSKEVAYAFNFNTDFCCRYKHFLGFLNVMIIDLLCNMEVVKSIGDIYYLKRTRTLIDNLDTGLSAVSITVKYNGFFDCLKSLIDREGFWALYSVNVPVVTRLVHLVHYRVLSFSLSLLWLALESKILLQSHMIPPSMRDPTQFPTFGESVSQIDSSFGPPPFPFPSNRTNVFGSPFRENDASANSGSSSSLAADRTGDPFSG
uniref:Peroxin-13 n=1 Tax=Heterorhabditis bacteriophora TaxID=37862 RepID=A0A1I7WB32_HETBA